MILDRLLAGFFLVSLLAYFGVVIWFVSEFDLVVLVSIVGVIAAYFLLIAPFKRNGRNGGRR